MLLCYVIDSGLSTSFLLLVTLIIMFYITLHYNLGETSCDCDSPNRLTNGMFFNLSTYLLTAEQALDQAKYTSPIICTYLY